MKSQLVRGELAKAVKLASALDAPIGAATKAALATVIDRSVLRRDDAGDYRTAGATTEPEVVRRRLKATFAAALDHARANRMGYRVAMAVGVVLHAIVTVELARRRLSAPLLFGAPLAIVVAAWAVRRDSAERAEALAAFDTLQEALYARALLDPDASTLALGAPAALVIEAPGAPPREVILDEPVIKIGRAAGAQVQLDGEGVARAHAVIENDVGALSIIDLGAGGTSVNGASVDKRELRDGDRITIGPYTLTVRVRA